MIARDEGGGGCLPQSLFSGLAVGASTATSSRHCHLRLRVQRPAQFLQRRALGEVDGEESAAVSARVRLQLDDEVGGPPSLHHKYIRAWRHRCVRY